MVVRDSATFAYLRYAQAGRLIYAQWQRVCAIPGLCFPSSDAHPAVELASGLAHHVGGTAARSAQLTLFAAQGSATQAGCDGEL